MLIALASAFSLGLLIYWLLYQPIASDGDNLALIKNLALQPPRTQQKKMGTLESMLLRLPLTRTWRVRDFYLLQVTCGVLALTAYVVPALVLTGMELKWTSVTLVGTIAFYLPYALLALALRRRHELLGRAVYDLLSHLVLQMSAHKNTMLAFQTAPRAVREPLREELNALLADLKLRPMPAALQAFAQRTGHPYLEDFAQAINYQRSLSIEAEEVFRHQEDLYRRNLRERTRTRAKIYEASVAGASMILFGNCVFLWMVPTYLETSKFLNL